MLVLLNSALAAPSDLAGRWHLAETRDVVQARVDAAVESTLAPFNLVVRGLARGPLSSAATFCDGYAIRADATTFELACDGRGMVSAAFGGPPVPGTTPNGKPFQVSARLDGDAVVLDFRGDEGWQRSRYRSEGASLRVEKTIHSDRLDADVTWEMRYQRE